MSTRQIPRRRKEDWRLLTPEENKKRAAIIRRREREARFHFESYRRRRNELEFLHRCREDDTPNMDKHIPIKHINENYWICAICGMVGKIN